MGFCLPIIGMVVAAIERRRYEHGKVERAAID